MCLCVCTPVHQVMNCSRRRWGTTGHYRKYVTCKTLLKSMIGQANLKKKSSSYTRLSKLKVTFCLMKDAKWFKKKVRRTKSSSTQCTTHSLARVQQLLPWASHSSISCLEPPILPDITVNRVIQCCLGENKWFNEVTSPPGAVVTSVLLCESTFLTILNTYQWFLNSFWGLSEQRLTRRGVRRWEVTAPFRVDMQGNNKQWVHINVCEVE